MKDFNAANERIKHAYLAWKKSAQGQSDATLDTIIKALNRFDEFNKFRDFKSFRHEQADAFKRFLSQERNIETGDLLSASTLHITYSALRAFFHWLCREPGYRHLKESDAEYFRLSRKEERVARSRRDPRFPTEAQIVEAMLAMPTLSVSDRRDQALVAFILLTGSRDGAAISIRIGDIDINQNCVNFDARHVETKYSKSFVTAFFPVDSRAQDILLAWLAWLTQQQGVTNADPAFPASTPEVGLLSSDRDELLIHTHWKTTQPIRRIFRSAFTRVGLPYFHPHTVRHTIAALGERLCRDIAEQKAWSKNLGHEHIRTTFESYGLMDSARQVEIIRSISTTPFAEQLTPEAMEDCLFRLLAAKRASSSNVN